jgi:hypothetical protein
MKMAKNGTTKNDSDARTAPHQNTDDLWNDADSEEITSTPKMCAYDPLTRL